MTIVASVADDAGTFSLRELTREGDETILFSSDAEIPLGTRDSVTFYGRKQATGYDIYARSGTDETLLGTVPGAADLGATATDVYALAPGPTSRLWRIPRTGGTAVEAASVSGGVSELYVGDAIAAFRDIDKKMRVVALPGPSTPTFVVDDTNVSFIGDRAFFVGFMSMDTWIVLEKFPSGGIVLVESGYASKLAQDDRYLYVEVTRSSQSQVYAVDVDAPREQALTSAPLCADFKGAPVVFDDSRMYAGAGDKIVIGLRKRSP